MADDDRITISPTVSRETYARFRSLCLAIGVPIERGIEEIMRRTLEQTGLDITDGRKAGKGDAK
jgi:hypothetical protein